MPFYLVWKRWTVVFIHPPEKAGNTRLKELLDEGQLLADV